MAHAHEGWTIVDKRYDDGGFTGANTERPAFQRLQDDIEAGTIDLVVVYKVGRLSRSLLDFARVMDSFHTHGAEFVSVTQNFSTTNALGKLTLNILMSFAEFEREMIAERIRDKLRRREGMTPQRLGQILELTLLAPDIQEEVLFMESVDGVEPMGERALRGLLVGASWKAQRAAWANMRGRLRPEAA